MTNLKKNNFFFFYDDCSFVNILPNTIEHAYLAIINEDLVSAKEIFKSIDNSRAKWGVVLTSVLNGYLDVFPTYFQIRNFMEIDLDFLIKNEKLDYVEQLLGALEIFCTINQEAYKFAARVMFENNLLSAAFNYMQKSKELYYKDPELHFMFARYYIAVHDYEKAYLHINECLNLIPDYYPALLYKQKIEELSL